MTRCISLVSLFLVFVLLGCAGGMKTETIIQVATTVYSESGFEKTERIDFSHNKSIVDGVGLLISTNCSTEYYQARKIISEKNLIISIGLDRLSDDFVMSGGASIEQSGRVYGVSGVYLSDTISPEFLSFEMKHLLSSGEFNLDSILINRLRPSLKRSSFLVVKFIFDGMPNVEGPFLLRGLKMRNSKSALNPITIQFDPEKRVIH